MLFATLLTFLAYQSHEFIAFIIFSLVSHLSILCLAMVLRHVKLWSMKRLLLPVGAEYVWMMLMLK